MGETDGRLLSTIVATLKTYDSPWQYLEKEWKKFATLWHWYEFPNNTNFYYYRLHSALLRVLPITFLVLAPLSICGLILANRRFGRVWPAYMMVAMHVVSLLGFHVQSRYRIPLMALLIPFAGFAIVRVVEWLMSRHWLQSGPAVAAMIALAVWTARPLSAEIPLIRPADYIAPYYTYYDPLVQEAARQKDWSRAALILKQSLQYEPLEIRHLNQKNPAGARTERQLASWYSRVYRNYAKALRRAGDEEGSKIPLLRAEELIGAGGRQ
jgi:hypothetical protein